MVRRDLALLLVARQPANAQMTWNPVKDFSITSNPNGVWSYGWAASLGAPLNLYPVTDTTSVPGMSVWLESGAHWANPPLVATTARICVSSFCVPPAYLQLALEGRRRAWGDPFRVADRVGKRGQYS